MMRLWCVWWNLNVCIFVIVLLKSHFRAAISATTGGNGWEVICECLSIRHSASLSLSSLGEFRLSAEPRLTMKTVKNKLWWGKKKICSTLCCCSNLIVAEFKFSQEREGGKQQQQGKSRVRSGKKFKFNSTWPSLLKSFFLLLPLVLCVVPHCLRSYVCFASEHWGEFTAYMDVGECMSQLNAEKTRGKWIFSLFVCYMTAGKFKQIAWKTARNYDIRAWRTHKKNCCVMKKNWTRKSIESESIKCALYI